MTMPNDLEDEPKVRFLTKAVDVTELGLNAQQRIPTEPSFQVITNAPHSSMTELDLFCEGSVKEPRTRTGKVRKSLWTDSRKGRKQEAERKEMFITEFAKASFTSQRRCGRDPWNVERSGANSRHKWCNRFCFNCEKQGWSLQIGEKIWDKERIQQCF